MFPTATVPARAPFRLRPVKLSAPTGRHAFLAHGEACLPGLVLGEGDVLCVGGPAGLGAVEVFAPVVLGHPMLGQVVKQQLCSLPGGIPCAARHWESLGAVRAVWRSLAEPRSLGAAPANGSSGAPARRAICVRVPAPAVGLTRAAHPEWMGRPMQLVERGAEGGAVPTLVFTGIGGMGSVPAPVPVPAPLPSPAALASAAALVADLLGAGAEIEEASPSELRVVAHLSLDLRAATALAYRLGRQVRLPLSVAVADDLDEARHLARRLGLDQLLFVLAGLVSNELANEPAQHAPAPQERHLPAAGLGLAAAHTAAPATSRRALRHVPPAEGPVQLRLFGGVEAA